MWEPPRRPDRTRRFWILSTILMGGALLGAVSYMVGSVAFSAAGRGAQPKPAESAPPASTPTSIPAGTSYVTQARAAFTEWESRAFVLVQQGEQLQANSSLLGDAKWQADTANAVGTFQQAVQKLRALPAAPAGFEQVGAAITELANASDVLAGDINALLGGDFMVALRLEGDVERGMAAHDAVQQALQAAPPG